MKNYLITWFAIFYLGFGGACFIDWSFEIHAWSVFRAWILTSAIFACFIASWENEASPVSRDNE